MIDEERPASVDHDGDGYLYDFFKYLTSLSLISFGGLFTFLQTKQAAGVPDLAKAAAAALLGMAALLAFVGAQRLVGAKAAAEPIGKDVRQLRQVASYTFLFGLIALAYVCGDVIR